MLTTKLTGEDIPDYDSKILELIDKYDFNGSPDGIDSVIGIDNLKGKVYRYINFDCMDDYLGLTELITVELDMVDVLGNGSGIHRKGCDNRFRPNGVSINGKFIYVGSLDTNKTQGGDK